MIYVDDFKLSGPSENLEQGWKLLQEDITIEAPQPIGRFLGCIHEMGTFKLPTGKLATSVSYNMEGFLIQCCDKYSELAGGQVRFKKVATPFLIEDSKDGPAGTPAAKGPVVECPWCLHTFPPIVHKNINELDAHHAKTRSEPGKDSVPSATTNDVGKMGKHAACILMKCLYAARMARFDLLRAITHLACQITRWTSECDRKLYRLMCYIHSSLHLRMVGWVGDDGSLLQPHLFADADFAGCSATQRSTSGLHMSIRGPNSCFPISGQSKRQSCVSHSTPEAEIVAGDFALRLCGLPALDLWHTLLPHKPPILFHEDNQAMINVVSTGRNPTMRYLRRTHRVSVSWLYERFKGDDINLVYEISAKMAADIYTKAFTDGAKWDIVCNLINILDPKLLKDLNYVQTLLDNSPLKAGGPLLNVSRPRRAFPPRLDGMRIRVVTRSKLRKSPSSTELRTRSLTGKLGPIVLLWF